MRKLDAETCHTILFCFLLLTLFEHDITLTDLQSLTTHINYSVVMEDDDKDLRGTGTATARTNTLMSSRRQSVKNFFNVRGSGMSESDVKAMLKKKYDKDNNGVFDEEEVDDMMSDLMGYMSETKKLRRNSQILEDDNSRLLRKVSQYRTLSSHVIFHI